MTKKDANTIATLIEQNRKLAAALERVLGEQTSAPVETVAAAPAAPVETVEKLNTFSAAYPGIKTMNGKPIIGSKFKTKKSGSTFSVVAALRRETDGKLMIQARKVV